MHRRVSFVCLGNHYQERSLVMMMMIYDGLIRISLSILQLLIFFEKTLKYTF